VSKELILYTAKGCQLCEEIKKQLELPLARNNVVCHIIDIDGDLELQHRYAARIPVLVSGNQEICEGVLDVLALESFLLDDERQI